MKNEPSRGAIARPAVDRLDKVGATASLMCAIHCAAMPLVVTLLPLIGLGFLADNRIEWALVALSALMGVTSLCLGFREHRSRRAFAYLGIGIGMLATGRILEDNLNSPWGVGVVVLGGVDTGYRTPDQPPFVPVLPFLSAPRALGPSLI